MAEDIRVKVTTKGKFLIIETVDPTADKNFVPMSGSNMGCSLIDTKNLLGISKEAMNLIKTMKKGGDDLGDLNLWKSEKRGHCFAWLGGIKRLVDATECELSRDSIYDIEHTTIKNNVPIEAFESITRMGE
jgi:hypothetical protein